MMPYKPKHCCQCGEKIDRVDWKPWTSRRFCPLCETELSVYDWAPRILFGVGLLFGLYGVGIYFQKPEKQLSITPNYFTEASRKSDAAHQKTMAQIQTAGGVQPPMQASNSAAQIKLPSAASKPDLKSKQPDLQQLSEPPEKVYFCGAPTKKGTMCSRRIKKGGRCWQHEGQTALLPQEKLIAAQ